jgi:hypothetical protein
MQYQRRIQNQRGSSTVKERHASLCKATKAAGKTNIITSLKKVVTTLKVPAREPRTTVGF